MTSHVRALIDAWFENWACGDYKNLPISEGFTHTSPFGIIEGKAAYIELVNKNKEKFLGYRFIRHDEIYEQNKACVRYTAIQNDFALDVSEWYYIKNNLIEAVIAYYHIGDITPERVLSN